jgi:hypothetical protein
MSEVETRSMMLALRAWLDADTLDDRNRNGEQLVALIIAKAMNGHFGYFKLLLDAVDGRLHQANRDEMTFEPCSVLIVANDEREQDVVKAA